MTKTKKLLRTYKKTNTKLLQNKKILQHLQNKSPSQENLFKMHLIQEQNIELENEIKKILEIIDLTSADAKEILTKKYIESETWDIIAYKQNKSISTCKKLINEELVQIDNIFYK